MRLLRVKGWWDCMNTWGHDWLYLAVFPAKLKIGVTSQPQARFSSLPAEGGHRMRDIEDIFLLECMDNRRRETLIKQCFGELSDKRRHKEWFGREHLALSLHFMLHPEDAEHYLRLRLVAMLDCPTAAKFQDIRTLAPPPYGRAA